MKFIKILFKIVFCLLSIVTLFGLGAVAEKAIGVTDKVMDIFNEKGTENYTEFKTAAQDLKENEWVKVSISGTMLDADGEEDKTSIKNLYVNANTITDAKGSFKVTYTLVEVDFGGGFMVETPIITKIEINEDGKFIDYTSNTTDAYEKIGYDATDLMITAATVTDLFFFMFDDLVFDELSGNYYANVAEGEDFDTANYLKVTKAGKKMFILSTEVEVEDDVETVVSKSSTTLEIVTKTITLTDAPEADAEETPAE